MTIKYVIAVLKKPCISIFDHKLLDYYCLSLGFAYIYVFVNISNHVLKRACQF